MSAARLSRTPAAAAPVPEPQPDAIDAVDPSGTEAARCSQRARDADEPLAATAPVSPSWLVIEHDGAWGPRVLKDGPLDPALAAHLDSASRGSGTTVLLARRPRRRARATMTSQDAHPVVGDDTAHRVWFAHTSPGQVQMRVAHLEHLDVLMDIDLHGLGDGRLPELGHASTEPVMFVCTNGRRDACCAIEGVALLRELTTSPQYEDLASCVMEVSHVGGHRFAPTILMLPSGTVHGRLDVASAADCLRAARRGIVPLPSYRGRSAWSRPQQAAEIGVRAHAGVEGLDDLVVVSGRAGSSPAGDAAEAPVDLVVRHRDGRSWQVSVAPRPLAARPESCGADPVPGLAWTATDVRPDVPVR